MCTTCTKEVVIGPQLGSKCELSRRDVSGKEDRADKANEHSM